MTNQGPITVIGGGLAGCEACWQLLKRGFQVNLFEMRPVTFSPAHKSLYLAELVCSNSLGSNASDHAAGILKEEMRLLDSLIMEAADNNAVPAGRALAVDRKEFSRFIEERLSQAQSLKILRAEVARIPKREITIIATGPLTSSGLAQSIEEMIGTGSLYFYDAISPIIEGDSLDYQKIFRASRYEPGGVGDYLNCPFDQNEYELFWQSLLDAKKTPPHSFEDERYFESCLPIEVLAQRGIRTLAYGPMRPVGLIDPRTGRQPYAVVQLRQEDRAGALFNMVGFQTKMTRSEQERVFRSIPGLAEARFARYGSIHRNTYICSPRLLNKNLQFRGNEEIFFAGQITGVEGYVESAAMGLLAGISVANYATGMAFCPPPKETALGALLNYITTYNGTNFQPMNINRGLFSALDSPVPKKDKGRALAERAKTAIQGWKKIHANLSLVS